MLKANNTEAFIDLNDRSKGQTTYSGPLTLVSFIVELQAKGQTSKNERIRSEKILTYIRVLQKYGTRAGEPYVKHIEDDIWELHPLDDRIFFFYSLIGSLPLWSS